MSNTNCKKYRIKEFLYCGHVRYQPQKKGWLFWHPMNSQDSWFFNLYNIPFHFKTLEGAQNHINCDKELEERVQKRAKEVIEAEKKFGKPKYICYDK